MWIFRDKTGLSVTPSLWGAIEESLRDSEYFVLMASPEAAKSKWVAQEVECWLSEWGTKNLLMLVTDGELWWDEASNDWDWSKTTALPQNLRGRATQEPLWVDLRWAKGEASLSLRHVQFRQAILDIAATLLGTAKESIESEDLRVYRRNRSAAYAAVLLIFLLAVGAIAAALIANRNRILAEHQTQIAESGRLAATALLVRKAYVDAAPLLAIEAGKAADGFEARHSLLLSLQFSPKLVSILSFDGHEQHSVAFSPDGKLLASASSDDTVRLWDIARHQPVGGPLKGHGGEVYSVAFSPDGKILASAALDDTVRLWDMDRHQLLGDPLYFPGATRAVFSPDGATLAISGLSHTVQLWDVVHHQPLCNPMAVPGLNDVAFAPDRPLLASAGADGTVRLWDPVRCEALGDPLLADTSVNDVAFSPDGKLLASASEGNSVQLWDVARRQPLGDPLKGHSQRVASVAFSPDGKLLASASGDQTVRLWDVARWQPVGDPLQSNGWVYSVVFSPDGKLLASASQDGTVRLVGRSRLPTENRLAERRRPKRQ